jgi:23S rRNA (adenine1618-N6)-methyltransferase
MQNKKRVHPKVKLSLHPRNKHRGRYNLKLLVESCPELAQFVHVNKYDDESVDFFNPEAVKMLNKALLKHYYGLDYWDVPSGYLCPPIPGRADYIHHISDLLANSNKGVVPEGNGIRCIDVGVGASCVYPVVGIQEYGWSFVGTEVDAASMESAQKIIDLNPVLRDKVELRLQADQNAIFDGVFQKEECFDLTICNPPFHTSMAEARSGTLRKLSNLKQKKETKVVLNFGGQSSELWCVGGEVRFVQYMIRQSRQYASSCFWFSTLISKQENVKTSCEMLEKMEAVEVKVIPMGQGNKTSRIVAWTFLTPEQQVKWAEKRWKTEVEAEADIEAEYSGKKAEGTELIEGEQ